MDQNQTVDNDLQKAIDDITNNTNGDPIFADPVAAPSSIPEGDTGKLDEPVGPFPEPKVETPPMPEMPPVVTPEPVPTPPQPQVVPPVAPPMPPASVEEPKPAVEQQPVLEPEPKLETESMPQNFDMEQLKKSALRDLIPILGKLNINPSQKFNIYRDIFEDLEDYTTLEPAYNAAREIPDETERAEALLYLVETIDKM